MRGNPRNKRGRSADADSVGGENPVTVGTAVNPLTDDHRRILQLARERLLQTEQLLQQCEQAGMDCTEARAIHEEQRNRIHALQSVFFPLDAPQEQQQ